MTFETRVIGDYKLAVGSTILSFEKDVERLLKAGFQPYGPMLIDGQTYFQPMVWYRS